MEATKATSWLLAHDAAVMRFNSADESSNLKLAENVSVLSDDSLFNNNWDHEDGLAFSNDFLQEIIALLTTLQSQPDVGPTGRGSVYLEWGSRRKGQRYLGIEIFEADRKAHVYCKNSDGTSRKDVIGMEDVNEYARLF